MLPQSEDEEICRPPPAGRRRPELAVASRLVRLKSRNAPWRPAMGEETAKCCSPHSSFNSPSPSLEPKIPKPYAAQPPFKVRNSHAHSICMIIDRYLERIFAPMAYNSMPRSGSETFRCLLHFWRFGGSSEHGDNDMAARCEGERH